MCFALPLKVTSITKNRITMEDGRKIDVSMVKNVKKGDFLLVQSNLVVDKLSPGDAKLMRKAIKENLN